MMVLLVLFAALVGGVAHPRTRRWFLAAPPPPALPSAESDKLREWKAIFRATVIDVDGAITPEMEAFLTNGDALVVAFLAQARKAAETDRAELLKKTEIECRELIKKAEAERAEKLKEAEEWTTNDRPLLIAAAAKEYQVDWDSCETSEERGRVIHRWHNKGFRFPRALRATLLKGSVNEDTRNAWRKLFDEQDQPTGSKPKAL